MALVLVAGPAAEPVSRAEAKLHLKVETTEEDSLIDALIVAARQACEAVTGLALITQTWRLFLDGFPGNEEVWWDGARDGARSANRAEALVIPRPPLIAIVHVKVYDQNDAATVMEASDYQVDSASRPGRVLLRDHAQWPAVSLRPANGVEIEFQAGFGASANAVPAQLRQGILQHVAHLYAHRGDQLDRDGRAVETVALPLPVSALYRPYRLLSV